MFLVQQLPRLPWGWSVAETHDHRRGPEAAAMARPLVAGSPAEAGAALHPAVAAVPCTLLLFAAVPCRLCAGPQGQFDDLAH